MDDKALESSLGAMMVDFHEHLLYPTNSSRICFACSKSKQRAGGEGGYTCKQCYFYVHKDCFEINNLYHKHPLKLLNFITQRDDDQSCFFCEGKLKYSPLFYHCLICGFSYVIIKHFSHGHDMSLVTTGNNERCYACSLPVYCDPYYACKQCHFILHETCANFRRLKRHELYRGHFTLYPNPKPGEKLAFGGNIFSCYACFRKSTGFRYKSGLVELDVRCATISGMFLHGSHPHSLFIPLYECLVVCSVCDDKGEIGKLSCVECIDFFMCFKCATIPNKALHKYDTHMLYLRYCGNLYGNYYWCEICEKPTNPKKWFYSCDKCDSTFHIDCVLGTEPYLKPGHLLLIGDYEYEVVSNNHISRPFCLVCCLRCDDAFVLKSKNETVTSFLCSIGCLKSLVEDEPLEEE